MIIVGGHLGIDKTCHKISNRFYWKTFWTDVKSMFSNVKLASVPMMHSYKNLQHYFSPFQLSPECGTRYVKLFLHKIAVTALTLRLELILLVHCHKQTEEVSTLSPWWTTSLNGQRQNQFQTRVQNMLLYSYIR